MNGGCSLLYPKQFQMSCGFSFGQLVQALDHHSHGRLPLLNSTSMPHPTQIIATLHLPPKLLFFIYCITYGDSMRLLLHIWLALKLLHFLHSNILYRLFILSHWPIMTLFWEIIFISQHISKLVSCIKEDYYVSCTKDYYEIHINPKVKKRGITIISCFYCECVSL